MSPNSHRIFRRSAEVLRRLVDVWPWTWLGLAVVTIAAILLWYFGVRQLDQVLLVLSLGALGLWALATLMVVTTAIVLKFRVLNSRSNTESFVRTETGQEVGTAFSLPALRWLPLVQLTWDWRSPSTLKIGHLLQHGRLHERVTPTRRGTMDKVVRGVAVSDSFGLCKIVLRCDGQVPLEVLPHLGALDRTPELTSLCGGPDLPHPMGVEEGDRVELRRYVPGDPARFINWKVFGRTRKLMVRMPERALTTSRRTIAYLVASEGDEASAAVARAIVKRKGLGDDWSFGADGTAGSTSEEQQALRRIIASGDNKDEAGSGLASFVQLAEKEGPAAILVFVPAMMGTWMGAVQQVAKARPGRVRFVVGVDVDVDVETDVQTESRWRRWLWKPKVIRDTAKDFARVVDTLSKLGAELSVIDRVTGRSLRSPHAHLAMSGVSREAA